MYSLLPILFLLMSGSSGATLKNPQDAGLTTRLVSVVFRHGDRAPDSHNIEKFPNDPYVNNTFFPEGPGGLTNVGKKREYAIGQMLRQRYDDFLGPIYSPSEVFARSTNYERTIMSLELVLAGLFPPQSDQQWESSVNWQPVVINLRNGEADGLGPLSTPTCPQFWEELVKVSHSPEFREKLRPYDKLFPTLTHFTGRNINSLTDASLLYHALMAESSMGLVLPDWTKDIFADGQLLELATLDYEFNNYNDNLKKLFGGKILKVITDNMVKVLHGSSKRKLNLFSGHEITVASFLYTLGIYETRHVPSYSAAVILELLEDSRDVYVKVLYYRGIPAEVEEKTIPGCSRLCPLEKFVELMRNVIPTEAEMECQS